jgi:6-phosphogluconate dehydrogenase
VDVLFVLSSLDRIKEAFDAQPNLENLLLYPYFEKAIEKAQESWRAVIMAATHLGLPAPAFTTALAYYDSYRLPRLPANLLQRNAITLVHTRTNDSTKQVRSTANGSNFARSQSR